MCAIRRLAYHEELIAVKFADSNRGVGGQEYLKGRRIFLRTKGIQQSGKAMRLQPILNFIDQNDRRLLRCHTPHTCDQ